MGWNSQPTRAVIFEDAEVPAENVIGSIGQVDNDVTKSLHEICNQFRQHFCAAFLTKLFYKKIAKPGCN